MNNTLLQVSNLDLKIDMLNGMIHPVRGIDFSIAKEETFALVGESGSGKSLTALSILRLLPLNAHLSKESEIALNAQPLLPLSEIDMRKVRAHKIGFIFQDPMSSLNPVMTIGDQLLECVHSNKKSAQKKIHELLSHVKIVDVKHCLNAYPHQLSGGMKQRVMIAMALAKSPDLLIADEPTTALDVTTQAQVLDLIRALKKEMGMSILLITHDLGVVAQLADRVAVMRQGEIVETGTTNTILNAPQHPYTIQLLNALPEKAERKPSLSQDKYEPILQVRDLQISYEKIKAVDGISFDLAKGQTLCLVGESGCGKTTTGKTILKLIEPDSGQVLFEGVDLATLTKKHMQGHRQSIQMIFQDPYSSMDPRMRIREVLLEGISALKLYPNLAEREKHIDTLLTQVGMPAEMKYRFPHEFSGGQRQRIAIARALSVNPKLIVCDEPTSSLDVSIQAQILNLLKELQQKFGLSYLFITHNLGVVRFLADFVAVMYRGRIVEYGTYTDVLDAPKHPYTQALLAAVPSVSTIKPVRKAL